MYTTSGLLQYFNNEVAEAKAYETMLRRLEKRTLRVQDTLAILNLGQGLIISAGLFAVMALACQDIVAGTRVVHVGTCRFTCRYSASNMAHMHMEMLLIFFFALLIGVLTVGDLVMVNGLLFQLSVPLGFLGTFWRDMSTSAIELQDLHTLLRREPLVKVSLLVRSLLLSGRLII